ncbi:MAG: VCBS repeat-containing protein [Singulisphaera sp.]
MTPTDSTGDIQMDPRSASNHRGLAALRPPPNEPAPSPRRRGKASRPNLEGLEDRCLLSFSPITAYAAGTTPGGRVGRLQRRRPARPRAGQQRPLPQRAAGQRRRHLPGRRVHVRGAQSVAVGDFNRDGKPDLVALFGGRDGVAVALGNGDGTFKVAQMTYTGMTPTSVVVGDLNADGKLDLVTTSYSAWGFDPYTGNSYGGSAGTPTCCWATATGPSSAAPTLSTSTPPARRRRWATNGDGTLDLAADGLVLLGNGDGSLRTPRTALMYTVAAAADVNADGRLDLVGDGVALGNGDGTFSPPTLRGRRPFRAGGRLQRRRQARPGRGTLREIHGRAARQRRRDVPGRLPLRRRHRAFPDGRDFNGDRRLDAW